MPTPTGEGDNWPDTHLPGTEQEEMSQALADLWASRFNAGFRSNLYHASTDDSYLSEFEPFSHNEAHSDGVIVVGLHPDTEMLQAAFGAYALYPTLLATGPAVTAMRAGATAAANVASSPTAWVVATEFTANATYGYRNGQMLNTGGRPLGTSHAAVAGYAAGFAAGASSRLSSAIRHFFY
jgi:hypothetical protein